MSTVSSIVRASVSDIVRSIVAGESGGGAPEPDSLLTDLVAWWSLDEASGTRVNAHNPGTHDLTDNNTVGQTTGVVGNAASFVLANSEYLSLAHHADFVIADTPVTYAGWAWVGPASNQGGILGVKGNPAAAGGEWGVYYLAGPNLLARVRNAANSATVSTANVSISNSAWLFFIFEHDPTNDVITLEVNRGTPVTAAITGGVFSASNTMQFGARLPSLYLNGYMDETTFWRRLLTTEEKNRLYNSGAGMAYPV